MLRFSCLISSDWSVRNYFSIFSIYRIVTCQVRQQESSGGWETPSLRPLTAGLWAQLTSVASYAIYGRSLTHYPLYPPSVHSHLDCWPMAKLPHVSLACFVSPRGLECEAWGQQADVVGAKRSIQFPGGLCNQRSIRWLLQGQLRRGRILLRWIFPFDVYGWSDKTIH